MHGLTGTDVQTLLAIFHFSLSTALYGGNTADDHGHLVFNRLGLRRRRPGR